MSEKKIRRTISFFLQGGKEMSNGSNFSSEPQPVFEMNPFKLEDGRKGFDYYQELGLSKSSYILFPVGRELTELFITYMLPTLPEATIPNDLEDYISDVERISKKRDWIWKQARKEVDVLSVQHELNFRGHEDEDGNFLADFWQPNSVGISSFYGTISMRGMFPFYRQNIAPMLPNEWGMDSSPALAIRSTNWGNIYGDDVVAVSGSYIEYVDVMPKRAVGVIA